VHPARHFGYIAPMSAADRPTDDQQSAPVSVGQVDFSTHVLSMASSAMIAMGQMPAPSGEAIERDIETARYLIDVISMLEIKTRGNLDEQEQKLLQSLLYDLRVAFVDASKS
jgi:hypothetical protein